ncbi:hypothetical protein [Aquiflexum gelatinilyticum]|uniref:Uncharacterized protein n=1 Tax=Aquiflexum gelatinilyticum TaxID=2961943 RepID=A0A9X2P984_9BACT|nr:hypothetical protein [Aquiflexum gelatinilyticum]MCR9015554.1 hypothetical protein [Aquiflexum gelatinilyticum]
MIKQNPFSLYDFLGYFIPGAITFYIILILMVGDDINSIQDIIKIASENKEFQFDKALFFIIISYCLGHLISYLSSITIENFANWKYDYPSKYLLGLNREQKYLIKKVEWQKKMFRILLAIIILPVSILDYILGEWFLFKRFYTKKLDDFLVKVIKEKKIELLQQLYPLNFTSIENYDFHRIISHYVYENSKNHQFRMTNYVSLYGFLRALCLICCFVFWLFAFRALQEICIYLMNVVIYENFNFSTKDFNWELFIILISSFFISYVYFMGFMKFYRRYTLEAYMLVAIDREIVNNSKKFSPPIKKLFSKN